MAAKLPHPVAFCTDCGAITDNAGAINTRCDRTVNRGRRRARCSGVYRGRLNADGWQECPSCGATGLARDDHCKMCHGTGWFPIRR